MAVQSTRKVARAGVAAQPTPEPTPSSKKAATKQNAAPAKPQYDAIIVGSGMSGITCAKELAAAGYKSVLLERQNRMFGRAYDLSIDGTRIGKGGSWLHGKANKLRPIAKALGFTLIHSDLDGNLFINDKRATKEQLEEFNADDKAFIKQMVAAAKAGRDGSAAAYLPKDHFSRTLANEAGLFENGVPLKRADSVDTALFRTGDDAFIGPSADGKIPGGAESFVREYAKRYGPPIPGPNAQVLLSTAVKKITYRPGDTKVETTDGRILTARKIGSSVSNGVLASGTIEFDPPLPKWKLDAVKELPMGLMNKLVLEYDRNVFEKVDDNAWIVNDEKSSVVPMDFVLNYEGKRNLAVGFLTGKYAEAYEKKPDHVAINLARQKLVKMFGRGVDKHFVKGVITHWKSDPNTYGSYSAARPGATQAHKKLFKPLNNILYFMGEAASDPQTNGSFEGAHDAGKRAGKLMADRMKMEDRRREAGLSVASVDEMLLVVKAFFTEEQWAVDEAEGAPVLRFRYVGDHGSFVAYAKIEEEMLVVWAEHAHEVPAGRRGAMAELLAHLNFGLAIGSFDLDLASGDLRFRTSIDVDGDRLSPALVRNVVLANVVTIDRFMPALDAVIVGQSPGQALALLVP